MKTVALYNLGCKVNSYEMEGMGQKLREKGYHIVPFEEKADIYVVNTCTVTNIADRKSRQILHRARQLNPDAVVVAVGCYVQTGMANIEKDDGIDLAIGNNHKKDIAELLERYLEERRETEGTPRGQRSKTLGGATVTDMGGSCEYEEMQLRQPTEHTRAYIKIQDGCNQFCSYCVIPYARGRVRSRRAEDILQEIRGLAATGFREVVLTGIHISSYGMDFGDSRATTAGIGGNHVSLIELAERIHEIPGLDRIRLGSLEPRIINRETAGRLAALPKVCPHFHLSLQSGCDATLKRMNRHYTTGEYYTCVEELRRFFHRPAITTDVIVGFPGETEEEFLATEAFLKRIEFFETHIFKYSRRKGTKADRMEGQLTEGVKAERSRILLKLNEENERRYLEGQLGRQVEILVEEPVELGGIPYQTGHTREYCKAILDSKQCLTGRIVRAVAEKQLENGILLCKLI